MQYVPRAHWGSRKSAPGGSRIGQVGRVILHHYFRPHVGAKASAAHERATMRSVQKYHMDQGWDDIGYNWVVYQSGRIYEGRGWGRSGAHTAGQNHTSVGIAFAINGDAHKASERAWKGAETVVQNGVMNGHISEQYEVAGHRDFAAKSCPGDEVYPHLDRLTEQNTTESQLMISRGTHSSEVAQLQHTLNRALYLTGGNFDGGGKEHNKNGSHLKVDGKFGDVTFEAYKRMVGRLQRELDHPIYDPMEGATVTTVAWIVDLINSKTDALA